MRLKCGSFEILVEPTIIMNKAKVIVSGVAWTIINNVVSILYGIVSVPFLINYFGKEEYGLIGLALSVNVYIQLLDMGMTNSNVRFFSEYIAKEDKDRIQKLFSLTYLFYTIVGLLNSIILFGLSFCVETLFKVTVEQAIILRNLLWVLALNATFSWISVCFDQLLRANELIDWIKKRLSFLKIMQFVILWLTIVLNLSIELYFFGYIFVATFILPWTILKTRKVMPVLKLRLGFDKNLFLTVYPYALSILSFSIFQFTAFNFRPLFLGGMSGPGAVAEFNVMNTIAMAVTVISGSFMQVLLPIVTKMTVKNDREGIQKMMFVGTKYVTILLSMIIFVLIASLSEIFSLYVGEEYVHLTKWMMLWLFTLLLSHRNVMTSLVFTENRLRSVAIMGALAMVLALLSYLIFIPIYGVGGVVIGFTVHELTHTLFYYIYFIPKKFGVNTYAIFTKAVLPVWLIMGIVGVAVFMLWNNHEWSDLTNVTIKTCICGLLFIMMIWYLLFNKSDKAFVLSLLGNRFKK